MFLALAFNFRESICVTFVDLDKFRHKLNDVTDHMPEFGSFADGHMRLAMEFH